MYTQRDRESIKAKALWKSVSRTNAADIEALSEGRSYFGISSFFRHRRLYKRALDIACAYHDEVKRPVTLQCIGVAMGQEPYSLAYDVVERGYAGKIKIRSIDASASFSEIAAHGIYRRDDVLMLPERIEQKMFKPYGENHVRVRRHFREHVEVLKPQRFEDLIHSNVKSDISLTTTAIGYVHPNSDSPAMARAVQGLAHVTSHAVLVDQHIQPYPLIFAGFSEKEAYDWAKDENGSLVVAFSVWRKEGPAISKPSALPVAANIA